MKFETLLDQPHLSIIASTPDVELAEIRTRVTHHAAVSGRAELEDLFCRLLAIGSTNPRPKTLDLIGHSTPGTALLSLGSWVIDAGTPVVPSYFRELAEHSVLSRLGIHAVRLLGSLTADTAQGQHTICALSEIFGLEVFGAKNLIFATQFDADGFVEDHGMALSRSSDLRRMPPTAQPLLVGARSPRVLDLDSIPAIPKASLGAAMWPRRFASLETAGELLRLVRRSDGRAMPGLLLAPSCEVALPSATPGSYHVAQVLLDGAFVRVYPDGPTAPGVCYSVTMPRELVELVDALPQAAGV